VDLGKENIAVAEARKLGLRLVAVVDTNCNPEHADFIVPGNDDAISSVRLMASAISKAIQEGVQFYTEVERERQERVADERDRRKSVKPTVHKPRSAAAKKLQEELAAKADASAVPDEHVVDAEAGGTEEPAVETAEERGAGE
jgi:small subunit ribosomal protein S2